MPKLSESVNTGGALAAACALGTIGVLIFSLLPFILGLLADELQLNDQQLGLLGSIYVGGYTLVTVLSFAWITRLNWKHAFFLAVVLLVAGLVVSHYWHQYNGVALGLFITGLGAGFAHALSAAVIAEMNDADRKFGIKMIPEQAVAAILLFLLPVTVVAYWGLPGVLLSLAVVFLSALAFAEHVPASGIKQLESRERDKNEKAVLVFIALFGLLAFFGGIAGIWAFLERFAVDGGLDKETIRQMLALGVVSSAIGPIIPALIGSRFGRSLPLALCTIVLILSITMLSTMDGVWKFAAVLIFLPIAWYAGMAYQMGVIAEADHSGRFSVLMTAALGVGATIGPALIGALKGSSGSSTALLVATIIVIAGVSATLIVVQRLPAMNVVEPK